MAILRSFLPWIVFFILSGLGHSWIGAFAAVVTYIFAYGKKVGHLKVLDKSSMLFFLVTGFLMLFWHPIWFAEHIDYFANGFLAAMILYTIVSHKPFTLEFARESTPKEKWNTPEFYRINVILSGVWFLYFALSLPLIYLSKALSPWFHLGQGGLALLAIGITELYPKLYQGKE